jgi:hypothetical protein
MVFFQRGTTTIRTRPSRVHVTFNIDKTASRLLKIGIEYTSQQQRK